MSHSYLTSYQRMNDNDSPLNTQRDEEGDSPNENFSQMLIHVVPQSDKTRWNHIEDLDSFFTRVYQYHQQNGFTCMMVKQVFDLFNFAFITIFTTFLFTCVDYGILFRDKKLPGDPDKITISDCLIPLKEAWQNTSNSLLLILVAAFGFWLLRLFIAFFSYFHFCEIKKFYNAALGISDAELENVTWTDVQQRLMEVQVEQRMCIHKDVLTELDIYHRILRFKNYFIAMVNKDVIPIKMNVPFAGDMVFLTRGLQYNIDMILFYGIGAPFINNWQLKDEFKRPENRHRLAEELSKRILYVGLLNFFLFPFIFLFQILRSFFHYTDILKREPGFLGMRTWSNYGEATLRHYNELEHELRARLNRAYKSATQYLNSFTSALMAIIARHIAFICGSVLAVLAVLTIYDEDVIQVEHILTIMTLLAAVTAFCRVFIPKENLVWCPELLMTKVLSEVHYLPDSWKGKAHTSFVRNGFSQIFQYKFIYMIESLLSPFITPAILCFRLRHKSLEIVDFLRNFTVEVIGVGDICSFAQMNLRKHGSKTWHPNVTLDMDESLEPHEVGMSDGGKTELSLLHFTLTNPGWKPPEEASLFIDALKTQARKDYNALSILPEENALYDSVNSVGLGDALPGKPGSNFMQSRLFRNTLPSDSICGSINHLEGSRNMMSSGILGSLTQVNEINSERKITDIGFPSRHGEKELSPGLFSSTKPQDLVALDMSVSTLYLHELHRRFKTEIEYRDTYVRPSYSRNFPVPKPHGSTIRTKSHYQSTVSPVAGSSGLPTVQSETHEDESSQVQKTENTPLLNV